MEFYDLNVRGQNFYNDLKLIKEASKLGWNHINLNYSPDYYKKALEYQNDLSQEVNIDISMGINIVGAKNQNEARKIANKFRSKSNYISCLGGDLKINRGICENIKMDVLSRPYYKRHDSGMNHVLAKLAAKNNVAIELCFRDILNQHLKYRANAIASFKQILMFHRKYKFPLILTTDTKYIYDVRSTRDIVAVFKSIGFTNEEIYNGFYKTPKEILNFNKQRKNIIVQGVKVIEGATDFTEVHKKEPTKPDLDNLFTDDIEEEDFTDEED
ncbi:MAG: RNase P subunit p30 family protein [Methanobacteriaceae archaeon]|nr:RNase P subunit p30 family protein [Methanobacteriaceae archaeon]